MVTKNNNALMGAIIGDIAGSRFEFNAIKSKEFELMIKGESYLKPNITFKEHIASCRFTDDTILTLAVAHALLHCNSDYSNLKEVAVKYLKDYGHKYPHASYGLKFNQWLHQPGYKPYNSFGNGSAMRVSPVAYFAKDIEEVKLLAKLVTEVTHNHPEGIKGAQAVACSVWLALHNHTKEEIKNYVTENFYNLDFDYNEILRTYRHVESCQESVPQSIYAFLISNSFEDTIRTAISMGGDADTMACIAGSIAEAYYGVPQDIVEKGLEFLTPDLKEILIKFQNKVKGE